MGAPDASSFKLFMDDFIYNKLVSGFVITITSTLVENLLESKEPTLTVMGIFES